MRKPTYIVKLKPKEQSKLDKLVHQGKTSARVINRARILLHSHHGKNNKYIAQALSVSITAIINLRRRFQSERLSSLYDKPRPGRPKKIYGKIEAQLVALACSTPPDGRARWTMRMLADRIVELDLVDSISHKAVWERLKKTTLNRGSKNSGV